MSAPDARVALRLRGISKRFGDVTVLDEVCLDVEGGEVHGLLGENGSGKSTLVKVLAGFHAPEPGGEAWAWGRPLHLPVRDADELGLAVIHQDLGLVDAMTIVENIGVSVGYGVRQLGSVNWRQERRIAQRLLADLGMDVDPDMHVATLSPVARTLVAIARARRQIERRGGERVLFVLDEPTAALPAKETEGVLELMRSIAASGDAVLFISHRLQEVTAVTSRVTVLRDGRAVSTTSSADADEAELARLMLGRRMEAFYPDAPARTSDATVLAVRGLSGGVVDDVSFTLGAGEIVGFTGLTGQGQEQLAHLIAGGLPRRGGEVLVGGVALGSRPKDALAAGVALVPANRRRDGLWPEALAWENVSLPVLRSHARLGGLFLQPTSERRAARTLMDRFHVVPRDVRLPATAFSGGNQQKLVLAKWLQRAPRLLLLEEPTQGVDAGARMEILQIVCDTAADGAAVAVFSSDLEQLASVCHRVLVMHDGAIVAERAGSELTEAALAAACQINADAPHAA